MAEPTIQLGGGNWAGKTDNLLGYYKKGERFYKQDFTFSRSTTGTYTDKDGYIQEMPYNLLQQSNDFDTTWGTSSVTISSGKSGYNGTNNAWSLNSSSEGYLFQYLTNETSNTLSIYAKAGSVNNIRLRFFGTSNGEGYFNLSNGTKGTTSGLANSSIENVGNGWYRCNISINTTISLVRIYPSVSSSSSSGTNGFVYIQNAQVNSGTSAKTYFPTTTRLNMPRVDYLNNSNGSLLIEPQRTNLLTYSEDFSNSYWTKSGASVTSSIVSPDGTTNAYKLVEDTSNSNHQVYRNTVTTTGSFSNTIFVKAAERSKIRLNSGSSSESVSFNLSNGTIISQTGATGKIVSMLNGWYKCTISWNVTSTAAQYLLLGILDDSGNASYTGNGSSGVYIWGAQFEVGAYETSYIPTSGSTVTRVAETCSQTPASGVIGQTEGVLFAEFSVFDIVSNIKAISLVKSSSPTSNAVILYYFGNRIAFDILNPSGTVSVITNITNALQLNKVALKYKSGDIALWFNGVEIVTRTNTISLSGLDKLEFDFTTGNGFYGKIKQLQVYKTALTDTQLATLTTI